MRILCVIAAFLLVSVEAFADMQNARFALHRKPAWHTGFPPLCDNLITPTVEPNYSPNYEGLPCTDYTVTGPLGASTVYIVVGQAGSEGVGTVSFGIDYDGRNNQHNGIEPQYVAATYCANGIVFPNDGGFGDFPNPKGGARISWIQAYCAQEEIGSHGVHAVVGALYVYAYAPDLLRLTPNNGVYTYPELAIQDCVGFNYTDLLNLNPPVPTSLLLGSVQFGDGSGGFTPCGQVPCSVTATATDVDPNTLNANAGGKFVTAHVELPSEYDPAQVVPESLLLNGTVAAVVGSFLVGDWNGNLVPDFSVKFPRDDVEATLEEGAQVPIAITGSIGGTCDFTGTDVVRVIRPRLHHPNGGESLNAGAHTLIEWQNPQGWTVDHASIYYSQDGGDTWSLAADQVVGQSHVWRAPQEPTENGRLRVVLVDGEGVMGYDSSDGPFTIQAATGVEQGIPTVHRLHANSPNPFRSGTRVAFDLPEPGKVTLKIFDLSGREVRVLADGSYPAGAHEARWDATDAAGQAVAGGIYFLHMKVGSFTDSKRMYLQR